MNRQNAGTRTFWMENNNNIPTDFLTLNLTLFGISWYIMIYAIEGKIIKK